MADEIQIEELEAEESGGRSGGVLRIVLLILGLSLGGAAGVLAVGPMVGERLAGGSEGDGGHGGGGHGAGETVETIHVIDNLVVNPAGSGGRRFLLVSVAIEPAHGDLAAIEAAEPELRAVLIPAFSSRDVEQLLDLTVRAELKAEVIAAMESVLGAGSLRRVLFPQFVVQ